MFTIKQNDTLPNLEAQLLDHNGAPINLDLCGVRFHMNELYKNIINRTASITDIANGKVKFEWQEGDTSKTGTYYCEFEINMPDGKIITVPNDGYFLISIVKELA